MNWISAKEPPKNSLPKLVYRSEENSFEVMVYIDKQWQDYNCFASEYDTIWGYDVAYWMDIPKLPKEAGDAS